MNANWEPKIGDVVEYVGSSNEHHNPKYVGGIGIVVLVRDGESYSSQLDVDWIVCPSSINTRIRGGLWAGNCKKLTEVKA